MLKTMIAAFFGCSHQRTTFPLTPKPGSAAVETYITCLDCGKEFLYDWGEMRRGKAAAPEQKAPGTFVENRV
ncbi:MAG TPA: hypothetical protein VKT49_10275 [Bryobacteraceae bacterium]|nr:hypothetical protein [Bryobacteraceae bacterium]